MQDFLEDLKAVFAKHNMATLGDLRLYKLTDGYQPETLAISHQIDRECAGGIKERGEFLIVDCKQVPQAIEHFEANAFQILDREQLIRGGVKSPLDDKVYYSRHEYDEHARKRGVELVGNDYSSRMKARQERMAEREEKRRKEASN